MDMYEIGATTRAAPPLVINSQSNPVSSTSQRDDQSFKKMLENNKSSDVKNEQKTEKQETVNEKKDVDKTNKSEKSDSDKTEMNKKEENLEEEVVKVNINTYMVAAQIETSNMEEEKLTNFETNQELNPESIEAAKTEIVVQNLPETNQENESNVKNNSNENSNEFENSLTVEAGKENKKGIDTGKTEQKTSEINNFEQISTVAVETEQQLQNLSAAGTKGDKQQILSMQVLKQAERGVRQMINTGKETMTIKVHPEHLGQINIRLSKGADGMQVFLTAESSETGKLLEDNLGKLQQLLQNNGVDLGSMSVGYQNQSSEFEQQREKFFGFEKNYKNGSVFSLDELQMPGSALYTQGMENSVLNREV